MAVGFLYGLAVAILCLSSHTSATMGRPPRGFQRPRGIDSLDQTYLSNFNASFREPMFRAAAAMGPASAIAGSTRTDLYARLFRRDTCDDNCATLSDGKGGKCCHTSDGGGWCCGENDECGPGNGNYCGKKTNTCSDLGSCSSLEGGGQGRCCTGEDVNAGSWCCGEQNLCGDGVNENYCSWAMETTTVVLSGTTTATVTDITTVTKPGSTDWTTVTSTSIKITTIPSADVATEVTFVTETAHARLAKRLPQPRATPAALSTTLRPHTAPAQRTLLITNAPWERRDIVTSTVTTTSTSYATQTETITDTSTEFSSVTSTSTVTFVSTFTSVLNAKTTTTVTSTITQPAAAGSSDGQHNGGQSSDSNGGKNGGKNGGGGGGGDGDQGGLSTGAKAGIGAGIAAAALISAVFFFFWRRHREKSNQEKNAALAAAGQYNSPNPYSAPQPMTDGHSVKYAAIADQMPQQPGELDSGPLPMNGASGGYSYELASTPVEQQGYPKLALASQGSPVEMYDPHPAPAEVSGVDSSQKPHPTGVTGPAELDEWRR